MESSLRSVIEKSQSILTLLPTKPHFDQVAAGLSLFLALKGEKEAQISSPAPITVDFNKLIGVDKISQEIGNKNLIIRFSDYKADDIEKVSYDIEAGQFRLTVVPKQKVNPPSKEQLGLSYSGIAASTVIIVGGANESHFPAVSTEDLAGADLVHIGIRDISFSSNKNYISLSRPASSVSELVYSLIKESDLPLDADIATNLLMGIEEGSNNFRGKGISSGTFSVVSELMKIGGKRKSEVSPPRVNYPPGVIPGQYPGQYQPQYQSQFPQPRIQGQPQMSPRGQQMPIQGQPQSQQGNIQQPYSMGGRGDLSRKQDGVPKDWLEPRVYQGTSVN
jgi:hypothetical protein